MLFINWVNNFDTGNHIWDECGLFNPTGAIAPTENNEFNDEGCDINNFLDDEDYIYFIIKTYICSYHKSH